MKSTRKILLLVSWAFVLCVGLPNLAQAINNLSEELEEQQRKQEAQEQGGVPGLAEKDANAAKGITTIHGEILQFDRDQYLIRKYDGDIVRLHIDDKTHVSGEGERSGSGADDSIRPITAHPFDGPCTNLRYNFVAKGLPQFVQ